MTTAAGNGISTTVTGTCKLPSAIPPGEVRRFDITVQAPILLPDNGPISILNIAAVQSGAPDLSPSNNSNDFTVAAGTVHAGNSAVNFSGLLLPLLVFGVRSTRRKK